MRGGRMNEGGLHELDLIHEGLVARGTSLLTLTLTLTLIGLVSRGTSMMMCL